MSTLCEEITIKGKTLNEVIHAHKDRPQLYPVIGGGSVIGQEIDEANHLLYIVKKDGKFFVEHAQNYPIVQKIPRYPGIKIDKL